MPRHAKFSRDEVIASACEVARKTGIEGVTAQSVAKNMNYTGSSLFTHFSSMEEIKTEVYRKAKEIFYEWISDCSEYTPVFKAFGMKYVEFAMAEPHLYRLLCAGSSGKDVIQEFEPVFLPMVKEIMTTFSVVEWQAREIFIHCITLAHGIASLNINGNTTFTKEQISRLLSECCIGTVMVLKTADGNLNPLMARTMVKNLDAMPEIKERE